MLLVHKGSCQCDPEDLKIVQSKTGAVVRHKPEWNATINKDCPCVIKDVSLICPAFRTTECIDPSALAIQGDGYLLNHGEGFNPSFNFTCAWDDSYPFKVDPDFRIECS
ncbi:hypothetical protein ACJRO7_014550 [Eucalyptus globulus]|uniref:Uncharacterized protein n=1 Tax=Eucalyptus globulus TaxID=34317 RepID=A0ABD3L1E1_EUCGL